jgi:hypothetical protein
MDIKNNNIEDYNLNKLEQYLKNNIISNNGRDVTIKWYTNGKESYRDFSVIDYKNIMWEYNNKIINKNEMTNVLKNIENILKDNGINLPIKCITTVNNIKNLDEDNFKKNKDNNKNKKFYEMPKPTIYSELEDKKNKEEINYIHKIKRDERKSVYATISKDNNLFCEKEQRISFREIMGFKIHNDKHNVSICLDYWKDDEKIVLRVEDKDTGKVSKILIQESLSEILDNIKKIENNCGYN